MRRGVGRVRASKHVTPHSVGGLGQGRWDGSVGCHPSRAYSLLPVHPTIAHNIQHEPSGLCINTQPLSACLFQRSTRPGCITVVARAIRGCIGDQAGQGPTRQRPDVVVVEDPPRPQPLLLERSLPSCPAATARRLPDDGQGPQTHPADRRAWWKVLRERTSRSASRRRRGGRVGPWCIMMTTGTSSRRG